MAEPIIGDCLQMQAHIRMYDVCLPHLNITQTRVRALIDIDFTRVLLRWRRSPYFSLKVSQPDNYGLCSGLLLLLYNGVVH